MNTILIFIWIYAAMIATSYWESHVEGKHAWDKGKLGWKIKLSKKYCLTEYHFFVFIVMWPILLSLPLIIYGWNIKLFGILISAFFSGMIIEDFMWFVVNPVVNFSHFNSKFVKYYPWLRIGKFEIPWHYIIFLIISFLSWYFIWS